MFKAKKIAHPLSLSERVRRLEKTVASLEQQLMGRGVPPHEIASRSSAQAMVDAAPIRGLDTVKERLQTIDAVLQGTAWLTAEEVGERAGANVLDRAALVRGWVREGRVFAIEHAGQERYPDYAFDSTGIPIPALRDILIVLNGYAPFRLASWFESRSSLLEGRPPPEIC